MKRLTREALEGIPSSININYSELNDNPYIYRNCFQKRDMTHCYIMKTEVKAFIKKEVMRLRTKETLTPEDATEVDAITKLIEYWKKKQ